MSSKALILVDVWSSGLTVNVGDYNGAKSIGQTFGILVQEAGVIRSVRVTVKIMKGLL